MLEFLICIACLNLENFERKSVELTIEGRKDQFLEQWRIAIGERLELTPLEEMMGSLAIRDEIEINPTEFWNLYAVASKFKEVTDTLHPNVWLHPKVWEIGNKAIALVRAFEDVSDMTFRAKYRELPSLAREWRTLVNTTPREQLRGVRE